MRPSWGLVRGRSGGCGGKGDGPGSRDFTASRSRTQTVVLASSSFKIPMILCSTGCSWRKPLLDDSLHSAMLVSTHVLSNITPSQHTWGIVGTTGSTIERGGSSGPLRCMLLCSGCSAREWRACSCVVASHPKGSLSGKSLTTCSETLSFSGSTFRFLGFGVGVASCKAILET